MYWYPKFLMRGENKTDETNFALHLWLRQDVKKIIECKLTHWPEKCLWTLSFLPAVACMTMQDELCRPEFNLWLLIASQSCLTLVFAARQVIFVFPIPTANISYQEHLHTSLQGMPYGLACASFCCTPSGAATWNQLQQRLRCRKLVHPVNGQHTCGV